jgi:dTMP kinase
MHAIRARRGATGVDFGSGYLIAFEGGEGAGKTTQMAALEKWLLARGEEVVVTREPGGTRIGQRVRTILLDPEASEMDARTEALLYAADRAQHVAEIIRPALEAGKIVLSDRFLDSSLAYQGLGRGLGVDEIYDISRWATGGIVPNLVFYMKVDPQVGLERLEGVADRLEGEGGEFHERVSVAYRQLAKKFPDRFVELDAGLPPSELHDRVVGVLLDRAAHRLELAAESHPATPR